MPGSQEFQERVEDRGRTRNIIRSMMEGFGPEKGGCFMNSLFLFLVVAFGFALVFLPLTLSAVGLFSTALHILEAASFFFQKENVTASNCMMNDINDDDMQMTLT